MLPFDQVALQVTEGQLFLPLVLRSIYNIFGNISERRDLDFPTHKVMVMTILCEEIANENLAKLASNENWLELKEGCTILSFVRVWNK